MAHHTPRAAVWLLAAGLAAGCGDRPANTPIGPDDEAVAPAPGSKAGAPEKPEKLARMFAKALRNPEFRAYLKASLDASPFPEHKVQFQRFLGASEGRALRALASSEDTDPARVRQEADAAIALEAYIPVPEHRAAWTGNENILVATTIDERDPPVAYDLRGNRMLLSPDNPPALPVIALVPVETDFDRAPGPSRIACDPETELCNDGGGSYYTATLPGLYMTYAHYVDDFEGWLKGNPEYEIHILGQYGTTDSLRSYQCIGEHAPTGYYYDQNSLSWSGKVLLFSQTQIDNFQAAHPGQNLRVFALEDDDTACEIKTSTSNFRDILKLIDQIYGKLTSGTDKIDNIQKAWDYASSLYDLLKKAYSLLVSGDDLIGNAVQDSIAGEYHTGANWILKGKDNKTNGWLKLQVY